MKGLKGKTITRRFLRKHPECIFVFGENKQRIGNGGAAKLRGEPNTYGFITKKSMWSSYGPVRYREVYQEELRKLIARIKSNPNKTFLISKIGSGLANKFGIFEHVIEPDIKESLKEFDNVTFLW